MTSNPEYQNIQKIFENVRAGNIKVGYIQQIYQVVINLSNIPKPTGFPQNIPNSSTDKFVGREKELERLHQQLQRNNEVVIAAVEGMGGAGKTELAIQYSLLHLQLHSYPGGICWLQARDSGIGLQILNFARTDLGLQPPDDLEFPERIRWCWKHWCKENTLIVLDDVKNYSEIKPYLPPQPSQFRVLITTRLKLDLPGSLYLEVLQEPDALSLLTKLVGEDLVNQEPLKAKELCQRLGNLPLALQLAGQYVKKRKIFLSEMLRLLENKGLGHPSLVVEENDPTWTSNIKWGVKAAFELSWSELSESAQELGCLLSLFALAPISWSLLKSMLLATLYFPLVEEYSEKLEDARVKLENLHLLIGEDTCLLHQLIREFFRNKQQNLAVAERQKQVFAAAMAAIAKKIPQTPTHEDIKLFTDNIPHLTEAAENLTAAISDKDLTWVFTGLGRFYKGQGLYTLAEPWCKQGLSVVKERLGDEHPDVALSLDNLADIYHLQGRYAEAESLYQQALSMTKRLLGDEHSDVALSLNNLALLYQSQGRYSEAESLYQQALSMTKRLLGEDHPNVAGILNNLAEIYSLQGRYSEAEPLYQQALSMIKRLLGEDHLNVATSLNNLAGLYRSQGRYSEAEPLYQQALSMKKRLLGEDHPDVALSLNSLAGLYRSQGRYSEAEPLYQQALSMKKRLLGEDHPDVALSLNNLAGLYESQGRYSEAEPLYQQALSMIKRLLGGDHPWVATSLNNLAELYRSQGRYSEAEPLYQQALSMTKRLLGEDHPDVALSLNNLALLYESQGRYAEAEPLHQQALSITKRLLGEDHPKVAISLNNLARLYCSQGRYAEAKPLYQQALQIFEQQLGMEHPYTISTRETLKIFAPL
ncbi:MAG: FxSxx-COOH system tetratricopeptide repeat protein [Cyanobacteria bacterium J06639_18]